MIPCLPIPQSQAKLIYYFKGRGKQAFFFFLIALAKDWGDLRQQHVS